LNSVRIIAAHLVDDAQSSTQEYAMNIQGKVAVITGGGSGIGRATAIVIADVDEAGARETAARIEHAGGAAVHLRADVTKPGDAQRMLALAEERFGGLDILFNNAGVTTGQPGFPQAGVEQWQRVLDVNLRAVVLGTQLALPALRRRGGGVIVHTASMAAFVGFPPDPVYAATKAAVVIFTHSMAPLAAENIRVNCVCPGVVNTPMLQRGRASGETVLPADIPLLEPEEIADAVVELITDDTVAGRALRITPGRHDFASLPPFRMPQMGSR
jgi:NAD(P)-dependent dehydrogenase (short-subunit alcohol dehydrogenase family)